MKLYRGDIVYIEDLHSTGRIIKELRCNAAEVRFFDKKTERFLIREINYEFLRHASFEEKNCFKSDSIEYNANQILRRKAQR